MAQVRGEIITPMVDLNGLSLHELRTSDDPALRRSVKRVAGRTECSKLGVLQNQAPDAR